jgi:hypothetical protein
VERFTEPVGRSPTAFPWPDASASRSHVKSVHLIKKIASDFSESRFLQIFVRPPSKVANRGSVFANQYAGTKEEATLAEVLTKVGWSPVVCFLATRNSI